MRRSANSSGFQKWGMVALPLFAMVLGLVPANATEIMIESTTHCCLASGYPVVIDPGDILFTYVSGAWTNHYNHVNWLGYVRFEIPSIGRGWDLGTEGMIPYASYEDAEQAAMGDTAAFVNDTGEPVTAYIFVADSCPYAYCHDNWGTVVVGYTPAAPVKDETWSTIKALYRLR